MEYRYREPEPNYSIWWQVALGVFLAMLTHSVITGLYERHELSKAMKQLEAETKKTEQQIQKELESINTTRYQPLTQYPIKKTTPLREGERCIQKRRFKRIENGWIQIPREPC